MIKLLITSLFVLLTFSANIFAYESQPLDDITNAAREFVANQLGQTQEDIQIVTGRLDRRLRLRLCDIPLEAYNPGYGQRQGRSTIGVRCNNETPWSIYVPVTVKSFREVAVLKHAVIRNTVLSENDIRFEKHDINRLPSGFFDSSEALSGKILAQSLPKGAVITKHLVKIPKVPMAVNRGQLVTLVAKNSTIEVRMEGKAMMKGAIGERIKVKNLKTKRIVEGIIVDKRLINVNL